MYFCDQSSSIDTCVWEWNAIRYEKMKAGEGESKKIWKNLHLKVHYYLWDCKIDILFPDDAK